MLATNLGHLLEVVNHLLTARLDARARDVLGRVRVDVADERRERRPAYATGRRVHNIGTCTTHQ
jgi:hypothetical protein